MIVTPSFRPMRLEEIGCTYLLPCKKEKDISLRLLAHVDLDDGTDGRLQVIALRFRRVEDLDRMSATGHAHQRSIVKVLLHRREMD